VCPDPIIREVELYAAKKQNINEENGDGDGGPMRFRFNAYFNIIIILDKKIDEIQQRVYVCMHACACVMK
jgi:hypothetical protein